MKCWIFWKSSGFWMSARPELAQNHSWNASHLQLGETAEKMQFLLSKAEHPNLQTSSASCSKGTRQTQISHSECSHGLPAGLQVTCGWSHWIRRSGDKAEKSLLPIPWYFSICFFSLLYFLKFYALDSVLHFFLKLSSALSIVTMNRDLISSIFYMFPSFCPPYPRFKRMLIGLPVKKCYVAASVLR